MKDAENTFYPGQTVIAIDAMPGSLFKNGNLYTVSSYQYKANPVNGLWFWYIGIVGHHDWLRPEIFAPYNPEFEAITFEKIAEENPVSVN